MSCSATEKVFGIPELLEEILLNAPVDDTKWPGDPHTWLFRMLATSRTFKATILSSAELRHRMCLAPFPVESAPFTSRSCVAKRNEEHYRELRMAFSPAVWILDHITEDYFHLKRLYTVLDDSPELDEAVMIQVPLDFYESGPWGIGTRRLKQLNAFLSKYGQPEASWRLMPIHFVRTRALLRVEVHIQARATLPGTPRDFDKPPRSVTRDFDNASDLGGLVDWYTSLLKPVLEWGKRWWDFESAYHIEYDRRCELIKQELLSNYLPGLRNIDQELTTVLEQRGASMPIGRHSDGD